MESAFVSKTLRGTPSFFMNVHPARKGTAGCGVGRGVVCDLYLQVNPLERRCPAVGSDPLMLTYAQLLMMSRYWKHGIQQVPVHPVAAFLLLVTTKAPTVTHARMHQHPNKSTSFTPVMELPVTQVQAIGIMQNE